MADRTIEFLLLAQDKASQAFDKVGDASNKASGKVSAFSVGVGTLGANVALGAVSQLGSVMSNAFTGAQEAERGMKVLNSQIANLGPTGQAAFSSASQFAEELSGSIAKDDDDIRAVQTKLASFPDAFKQGSLGAEGMRRATAAAFDLEAAGIGSAESNIMGVGKALNDPIKGMSALSKAGVSFSAEQKVAIQQAMQQGDLAKAQGIILSGIESNAKGAAAAGASNMDKLKVMADNFAEGLAAKAIPVVEKFAGWLVGLGPTVGPIFDQIGAAVSTVVGWFTKGGESGGGLATTLKDAFSRIWAAVGPVLTQIGQVVTGQVIPALSSFVAAATPIVTYLVGTLGPVVATVFSSVLTVIRGALTVISGVFNVFAGLLSGDWSRMWAGIKQIVSGAWTVIKAVFSAAWAAIKAAFSIGIDALVALARGIGGKIKSGIGDLGGLLKDAGRRVIDGFIGGITDGFNKVRDTLSRLTGMLPDWKGPAARDAKILFGSGRLVMDGFEAGLSSRYGSVRNSLGNFTDTLALSSAGGGGAYGGGLGRAVIVQVHAGAVGNEEFLARTVREVVARGDARGYGIG